MKFEDALASMKNGAKSISKREKILLILQVILSVAILVLAIIGLAGAAPGYTINVIDIVLLIILFIVCAIRMFPQRKFYSVVYIISSVILLVLLVSGLLI